MDAPKKEAEYKDTLNLPKTDFPMKADLARREPDLLARWAQPDFLGVPLEEALLKARQGAPNWILHDGPPYANGNIHYGHILNKILKDVVVKSRTMAGFRVEYKPGWDTHGLPIELAVLRELGDQAAGMSSVEIRQACHAYAMKWVDEQRKGFKRLAVFGTWDAPYLTLDPSYEATIVRQLAEFARRGLLYRDRKPVHWCMSDRTALAEAEIEYDEKHVSPSIYVKFATAEPGLFMVIWTTTPWTLPANHAIAYNASFDYVTLTVGESRYVVAEKLADAVAQACTLAETAPRAPFAVEKFAQLKAARHPFIDRASILVAGDHVTLEQGTGLVHTAPGHGADDYVIGKKHGLPVDAPVEDNGTFSDGPWKGEHVFKANPKIVAHLAEIGALLSPPTAKVTHSYPICWRCKNPVIFRATWQWFASLDRPLDGGEGPTLRQQALRDIGETQWIPTWGENRIRGMIENRPDWVLSRQRIWGVPIPVFFTERDGAQVPILDADIIEHVAGIIEKDGVDAWFGRDAKDLLPPGPKYDALRGAPLDKGNDIIDVWFESGVSWAAVCEGRPGLDSSRPDDARPIDLYLEGSDQHRGWFHSALLTGAATRAHAPYRAVLTHGFVVDENGRIYSKSTIEEARRQGKKMDYIPPEDVFKTQGAELLRLWTAAADFTQDIAYSRGHLTQLGESYRKVRNTARFLLGNLHGFDPSMATPPHTWPHGADGASEQAVDVYLWSRIERLHERVTAAYLAYEFHVAFKALLDFCINDLSSLYLDVRKDRLYCDAADARARRITQAVLHEAARQLALLGAPIFSFTAEEIWSYLPRRPDDPTSVHLARWAQPEKIPGDEALAARWEVLLGLRKLVQSKLEPFRAAKHSSLDAHVTLVLPVTELDAARALGPDALADLFIVSSVTIETGEAADARIEEATGFKCERCWKWTPTSPLCKRCGEAVANAVHVA